MHLILAFLFVLAIGKVGTQAYIRQQSASETIVAAYREQALAACGLSADIRAGSRPAGYHIRVELVIGKQDLNVRLWQTTHPQWSARFRDPFLIVRNGGREAVPVCEYSIPDGRATALTSAPANDGEPDPRKRVRL